MTGFRPSLHKIASAELRPWRRGLDVEPIALYAERSASIVNPENCQTSTPTDHGLPARRDPGDLRSLQAESGQSSTDYGGPSDVFYHALASRRKVMGKPTLPAYRKILGWTATTITPLSAAGMILTSGR